MLQKGFIEDMDNKYDWPGEMFLKAKNDNILFHQYEEWIAHHIILRLKSINFDTKDVEGANMRRDSTLRKPINFDKSPRCNDSSK